MVNSVFAVVKLHTINESDKHDAQIYHLKTRKHNNLSLCK